MLKVKTSTYEFGRVEEHDSAVTATRSSAAVSHTAGSVVLSEALCREHVCPGTKVQTQKVCQFLGAFPPTKDPLSSKSQNLVGCVLVPARGVATACGEGCPPVLLGPCAETPSLRAGDGLAGGAGGRAGFGERVFEGNAVLLRLWRP